VTLFSGGFVGSSLFLAAAAAGVSEIPTHERTLPTHTHTHTHTQAVTTMTTSTATTTTTTTTLLLVLMAMLVFTACFLPEADAASSSDGKKKSKKSKKSADAAKSSDSGVPPTHAFSTSAVSSAVQQAKHTLSSSSSSACARLSAIRVLHALSSAADVSTTAQCAFAQQQISSASDDDELSELACAADLHATLSSCSSGLKGNEHVVELARAALSSASSASDVLSAYVLLSGCSSEDAELGNRVSDLVVGLHAQAKASASNVVGGALAELIARLHADDAMSEGGLSQEKSARAVVKALRSSVGAVSSSLAEVAALLRATASLSQRTAVSLSKVCIESGEICGLFVCVFLFFFFFSFFSLFFFFLVRLASFSCGSLYLVNWHLQRSVALCVGSSFLLVYCYGVVAFILFLFFSVCLCVCVCLFLILSFFLSFSHSECVLAHVYQRTF
jgi:hypothetical protein